MAKKPTRGALRKDFFAGTIDLQTFKSGLMALIQYRGFHMKHGQRPQWSGPFHDTIEEADADNLPFFNQGFEVDVYQVQR
jgi:hypothetical protein